MSINLASTRLALVLLACLFIFILLSALIPQREISSAQIADADNWLQPVSPVIEFLKLDRIYTAPYFFVLLGLLSLNLAWGNIVRFRTVYRIERTLLRVRHLGSILFHFSVLLIIAGVMLNYLNRSARVLSLTERQTAFDRSADYHREFNGLFHSREYGRFRIRLDSLVRSYEVGGNQVSAAAVTLHPEQESGDTSTIVYAGRPLEWSGIDFHIGATTGYSVEIILSDTTGRRLFGAFVRLATIRQDTGTVFRDFLIIPGTDLKVEIEVLPDSTMPDNDRFKIVVETGTDTVYDSTVRRGDIGMFEQYRLTVPRLRQWCYIEVMQNPYLGLVFFGFWSALAGMAIGLTGRLSMTAKRKSV